VLTTFFHVNGIPEILNLQPRGNKAKAYQVKQVRAVIVRHQLARSLDDIASEQESEDSGLRLLRPDETEERGKETENRVH
jgi:hypothetical protein